MIAMTKERPIFENEEWLVIESGLEHKSTGYFIERESIANRRDDGLWTWPLHMAEKSWCKMTPFAEAFSCAAAEYGIETGAGLAQTFKLARREISPWPQARKQVLNPAPMMERTLRFEDGIPISSGPGSSANCLDVEVPQGSDDDWRLRPQNATRSFSINARLHPSRLSMVRVAALPWRTPRRIRKTGTKLVRLIQAAWNIR